jgi:hypothetical protein
MNTAIIDPNCLLANWSDFPLTESNVLSPIEILTYEALIDSDDAFLCMESFFPNSDFNEA